MSVQDRCMVCARRTIGSEIILDAPDGTTWSQALVEARFGPFGYSANYDARYTVCVECTIGSEIILDTPNGTPR